MLTVIKHLQYVSARFHLENNTIVATLAVGGAVRVLEFVSLQIRTRFLPPVKESI